MVKRIRWRSSLTYSLIAFLILAAYCIACLLYYFSAVDGETDQRMQERVSEVVQIQCDAIRGTLAVEFATLQSASHFVTQMTIESGSLFCKNNLQLLDSFKMHSYFSRTMLMDVNGRGYLDSGEAVTLESNSYFQSVMNGTSVLTLPQQLSNGERNVMLLVPVWKDAKAIGLFGGAYKLEIVSDLLFSDVCDGHAASYIADSSGNLICASGNVVTNVQTIFEEFSLDEKSGMTADAIRQDFLHGRSGTFQCACGEERRTISYAPLGVSEWMLVCAVPQSYVHIQYDFIKRYEMLLFGSILMGCVLFLLYIIVLMHIDRTRLSYQAKTDALSGLLNRAAAEEAIENTLRLSGKKQGVMMLMDLDHFKDVNDSYGHQMGDRLIAQVGQALLAAFRSTDYCCRLGGDEFLIFMCGTFSYEAVCERAQKLCDTLPLLLKDEISDVHWSLSIGVAYVPKDGDTFGELYRNADKALYAAKNKGRSCYCFYEE